MNKSYEMMELKGRNIFLKACNLSEKVYSFNAENLFMFYKVVIEKFGVKLPFTPFQWLALLSLKLVFSQINMNAWLMLVTFKYLCKHLGDLYPSPFSFFYFFTYSSRTHGTFTYFT